MILDSLLTFDPYGTSLANATGTYNSTNVVDLGVTSGIPTSANGGGARDLGVGDDPALKLHVLVTTAFTSNGSATLQATLQGAPDNGNGSPGTWYTMAQSSAIPVASLIAGARLMEIDMPRPPAGNPQPRFLRMQYTIATAAMTAGQIESNIVIDRFDQPISSGGYLSGYPAGITISN